MKKIVLILFLLCEVFLVDAQVAFYDALKLRNVIKGKTFDNDKKAFVDSILAKYLSSDDETINSTFGKNPFIKGFLLAPETHAGQSKIATSILHLGSLNVSNIADGIAQFLIKRGKEELNVAFFSRMKKFLDDPEHPEIKTLFPGTTEFLSSIETYRYAELIQSLREAFKKDLSNLITSLNQLIDLPKYKELLNNLPEIRAAIRVSKIVSELSQADEGILPASLITQLAMLEEWNQYSNVGNSFKLLNVLSQSIRYMPDKKVSDTLYNNSTTRDTISFSRTIDTTINHRNIYDTTIKYFAILEGNTKHTEIKKGSGNGNAMQQWIKLSDLNALVNDKITLQIFIGLLYQTVKAQNIQFNINGNVTRVDSFMINNAATISVISGLVENFAILANDVDRTIKDFKDKQHDGSLTNDDYYTYINKAINITEYGFKAANVIKENITADKYIIIARNANDLYKNIYTKNYNNAVMNAYEILNQIFNKLLADKNISAANRDLLKRLSPGSKIIEGILKYGNFMASVIKSESGEEVEKAIEAAALPAGSYSVKQKSAWNISVNGYIGYNWDFLKLDLKDQYASGIYAPVGISINHGSKCKHGIVLCGFASFIDVGSVAAYRLKNGNDDELKQEVRLESIFSPSGQLFLEIGGYPFAFGGGWKRTPKLFYSDKTSFSVVQPKNVFNLTVLIDIPFFTITNHLFEKK